MPDDDVSASPAYDGILDRILGGRIEDLDAVLAAEEGLSTEQREELRALASAFRKPAAVEAPDDAEPPFREVAGFRLLRRLGGGGAGVVWLARQPGLDRSVALKIQRPGLAFSSEAVARFEREGQALARLRHPNIVSVIASGAEHGLPWIAMEYVAGEGLDEVLRTGDPEATRPSIIQAVSWCRDVARALACSHEAGIIHRDVKPSNIRITYEGHAVLVDFGLAWQAGGETLTQTGWFRGSPRYASPEQVSTRSSSVDGRTDVYSLGVTLYEAVTGRPPFEGESTEQLFASILEGDAVPPRQIRQDIPRELETVIQTAMERDPKRRYPTVQKLADDLDALLGLRDILAKPPGLLRRVQKTVRRHPAIAMAAAAALLIAAALGIHHVARAAADRSAALSDARAQLVKYRDVRDRAVALEVEAAGLDDQVALRALTPEQIARHGQGDGAARAARVEAEALFQTAFDRADGVLAVEPGAADARDILADLCIERWRESLRTNDARMLAFWRDRVRAYDPGGRHAAELAGLGRARFSLTPPDASAWLFRYREEAELFPGGGRRLVPVPADGCPQPVRPGRWCLRVVHGAGEIEADDLVVDILGQPIEGTCFVDVSNPPARQRDVLVSIDGTPVDGPAQLMMANAQTAVDSHAFVFEREGKRFEVTSSLLDIRMAVARPDVIAQDGGMTAHVWHAGKLIETVLPAGIESRITATPLFKTDGCRAAVPGPQDLEPGSWVALVSAPGHESQRVPFLVPRRGDVEVVARLERAGTSPPGFVHVPAGDVRMTSRFRKRGGVTELGSRPVGAFTIMEREVLVREFLSFLNDPETPQSVRDGLAARAKPHGDRPASAWGRFRRKPDGRLEVFGIDGMLPINGVSFREARAYAEWRTAQYRKEGKDVTFEIPTDLELMRAACGVDGRPYAYGSWFSPGWQKCAGSRPFIFSEPSLAFPVDESPFGVFDLTGSATEWCVTEDVALSDGKGQGTLGGSFLSWTIDSLATVTAFGPDATDPSFGFRLVVRPRAAESR